MKKSMVSLLIGLAVGLGFANASQADDRAWSWSPLGIGLAAPLQLPFMESDVYGLRFGGFLGFNNDVRGIDLGVTELCTADFIGLQGALFTWTEGDVYGLQVGALANVVNSKTVGVQAGCVNADWGEVTGLQLGLINYDVAFAGLQLGGIVNWDTSASYGMQVGLANCDQDEFRGWSAGLVNYSVKYTGFQLGCFNSADEVTGYQVGLVNACNKMRGVQVGLVNLICDGPLPVMVIANASF